jgi:predicted nuclease of restriction endonuclease-like RecB superfamily
MSTLKILDETDLPWIANAVDIVEELAGEPWRVALDRLESLPVTSHHLAAVISGLHRVLGGGRRNTQLARRMRALVLGAPAIDPGLRSARVTAAARKLGLTDREVEVLLWADLPRERPVELPQGRPSELEIAAFANIQLIQRGLRRAQSIVLRVWGDAGAIIRAAAVRGLLSTLSVGAQGETVLEIVGPLALFHRTSVYGHAIAGLVPFLAGCERFELELSAESATSAYTMQLSSPVLLPGAPAELSETSVRARLARDLVRRAQLFVRPSPPPIVAGTQLVCPDLAIGIAGACWYVEIIGFWTAEYLARKLARYREAGITHVIFCIDELRTCADDVPPAGARVIGFRRYVDAEHVLEMIEPRRGDLEELAEPTSYRSRDGSDPPASHVP